MDTLKVKNFGPIQEANVTFGDLTFLVGPQASGKSLFLQLFKLITDGDNVAATLLEYGYVFENQKQLLELFFGEGMSQVWNGKTKIEHNGIEVTKDTLPVSPVMGKAAFETIFYIPAQRVIALRTGWPSPFSEYNNDTPFVLKKFSDTIRLFMNSKQGIDLFAKGSRFSQEALYKSVYYDGRIEIEKDMRKRFVLNVNKSRIPYLAWSAGQKEIMPLYLGIKHITYRPSIFDMSQYMVIIEEPEMGLHPQAIKAVILQILELVAAGYKVIVSTHSPVFLEFAWAFHLLKESKAKEDSLLELFDLKKSAAMKKMFSGLMNKAINTYYFNRKEGKVNVLDISSLDAGSENADISEWGGLSSFASRAGEIVSKNIALRVSMWRSRIPLP